MKTVKLFLTVWIILVFVGLVAPSANAQVTMALSDPYYAAENSALFSSTLNNVSIINQYDLIGIYQFNVTSGSPPLPNPFYATCLSPNGVLNYGSYSYTPLTFSAASPGLNPSAWASPLTAPEAGIQNANYLFSQLSAGIINAKDQAAGAAMALAMYTVLYNSTGYGTYNPNGPFQITGGLLGATGNSVLIDYENDLKLVGNYNGTPLADGYVLRPTVSTSQDMILLGNGIPNGFAVPEPTTVMAGVLLLLPLGVSSVRILRKDRAVGPSVR